MEQELTIEAFNECLNDTYAVTVDDTTAVEMELVEVTDLTERTGNPTDLSRPPFSIVFRGPATPVYEQRIYRFDHPTLGTHDIFIVPIGPDPAGILYEAIFS